MVEDAPDLQLPKSLLQMDSTPVTDSLETVSSSAPTQTPKEPAAISVDRYVEFLLVFFAWWEKLQPFPPSHGETILASPNLRMRKLT